MHEKINKLVIALKWWIVGKYTIFSFGSYFNSCDYVTFITKVCNKDVCDFKSKLIHIMGDKIRVTNHHDSKFERQDANNGN